LVFPGKKRRSPSEALLRRRGGKGGCKKQKARDPLKKMMGQAKDILFTYVPKKD